MTGPKRGSAGILGRGGQGVVYAATKLAGILHSMGYNVAQVQTYGAEVRGGSVLAYVVFDRGKLVNPYRRRLDAVVVLSGTDVPELRETLEESFLVVVDDRAPGTKPVQAVQVNLSGVAERPNMAALGCIWAVMGLDPVWLEEHLEGQDSVDALNGYSACSETVGHG